MTHALSTIIPIYIQVQQVQVQQQTQQQQQQQSQTTQVFQQIVTPSGEVQNVPVSACLFTRIPSSVFCSYQDSLKRHSVCMFLNHK